MRNLWRATPHAKFLLCPAEEKVSDWCIWKPWRAANRLSVGRTAARPKSSRIAVRHQVAGHADPIHLATCIESLLADPAHAKEMGARGRQRSEIFFYTTPFA